MGRDVDCDCNGLSGRDVLGFDEDPCGCDVNDVVGDPDEDMERRVVKEIELAISGLLSDIFAKIISESVEGALNW